mgnify:CR=1 FL=1
MAKLGSAKRPAVVHVRTMDRAEEILSVCDSHGWKVIVGIEPDKPEDVRDVEALLCVRGCVRGTGGRGPRLRTPFCCPREAPNPAYRP